MGRPIQSPLVMRAILCSTLVFFCSLASAEVNHEEEPLPYRECFFAASSFYGIDPALLVAIANVESGMDMSAININKNGSADFGLMQINSHWEGTLHDLGISYDEVKTSACLNIHVGAWVLASNFSRSGVDWLAVGAYNAGYGPSDRSRAIRRAYVSKVYRSYIEVTERYDVLVSAL